MGLTFFRQVLANAQNRNVQVFENLIDGVAVDSQAVALVDPTTGLPITSLFVSQGLASSLGNAWPVELTDGLNLLGTSTHPLWVQFTGDTGGGGNNQTPNPLQAFYNAITGIAPNTPTTVITLTVPNAGLLLKRVDVSGDNVSLFTLKLNGSPIGTRRSSYTAFNQNFEFPSGLPLTQGQVLTLDVVNSTQGSANYEATILGQ